MAALNFVELSKPFVEDGPCGPDLEDDVDFMNVTARLEVALPTAYFRRDDEGRQVAFDRTSIEFPAAFADLGKLMARSQDLRLFVLAAKLSILNRDVGGFVDCLSAMADILGENWDAVHPRAMDGDVIMREVALQGLDELPTVVLPLQHAPLFTSRRIGAFIFRSQLVATGETKLVEGEQHPDAGAIQAALAEVDVDELAAILARINAARDALARLRSTWLEKVGVDHPLGFPRLAALLDQIAGFLDAAAARRVPGHQAATIDRHQPGQFLMNARAVKAFVEVFPEDLPVAVHHLAQHMAADEAFQRPVAEVARGRIEGRRRGAFGVLREIDEDEAAPCRQRHPVERVVGLVEPIGKRLRGDADQITAQRIGPGMVGAGEKPRLEPARAFLAELRAPMPAGVVEGAQHACFVAQHDDLLRADADGAERQRLGKIGLAAGE